MAEEAAKETKEAMIVKRIGKQQRKQKRKKQRKFSAPGDTATKTSQAD